MFKIFVKHFIKDYQNVDDFTVREKYGVLCGFFGLFFNTILFSLKLTAGILTNSVAITGDGVNHISDAATSLMTIIGFKLSGKKPDKEHPFGHGRMEYVLGLIISFFIILVSFELFKSSIDSFLHPHISETKLWVVLILLFSILVKTYMYFYNHYAAQKINSAAMQVAAKDSLSDTLTTFVVVFSILINKFFDFPQIDGIAGIIVSIFIFMGGVDSIKDVLAPLLGTTPKHELVEGIESVVLNYPLIKAVHDIVIHEYGPGRMMITLHVEVPGDETIFDVHDVVDRAEAELEKKYKCTAVIHMDPIDFKSPKNLAIRQFVPKIADSMNLGITVHEVRCVQEGNITKVFFDLSKPFDCATSDDLIKSYFDDQIKAKYPDCICIMNIEHPYI